MEMRSYSQSLVASLICFNMLAGIVGGPEGKRPGSFWPVASILTLVPPTSMTRILGDLAFCAVFMSQPLRRMEDSDRVGFQYPVEREWLYHIQPGGTSD